MAMKKRFYTMNGEMMAYDEGGVTKDLITDHLGSITAEINQSQVRTYDTRYSAYGRNIWSTGTGCGFGWVGSYGYRETGLFHMSHYVRARHYSYVTGGWSTVDPLWPREASYGYVLGRAARMVDPSGRGCESASPAERDRVNGVIPNWEEMIRKTVEADPCCQALIGGDIPIHGGNPDLVEKMKERVRWLNSIFWCIGCLETDYKRSQCYGPHKDTNSTAVGPMGIVEDTWGDYGNGNVNNPKDNLRAAVRQFCRGMCLATKWCKCDIPKNGGNQGRIVPLGRPSTRLWPPPKWWPYMPGGTDPIGKREKFVTCMENKNHGVSEFPR